MIDDSITANADVQDVEIENQAKVISTPFPTPRTYEGNLYYGAEDVAKIIGITRRNVLYWHKQGLFTADARAHDGRYLYDVERVRQLKSVYHSKWTRGGYEESPTTKMISSSTIDALKRICADDLVFHGVIAEAPNHRQGSKLGYCCPMCGSGTGQNHNGHGDGAGHFFDDGTFYCNACDNANNGGRSMSTIDLFALSRNMQHDDFRDICRAMADEFGIDLEEEKFSQMPRRTVSKLPPPKPKKPPIDPAVLDEIRKDLMTTSEDDLKKFLAEETQDNTWRGLPFDILSKHNCKFIRDWVHPESRVEKKNFTPTPRIIIPAGADNYLARLTYNADFAPENQRDFLKSTQKQHAGEKKIFIAGDNVLTSTEPIFAVEGYIDALSIELAGFKAVASGGRGYDLIVNAVAQKEKKPPIIILFDADESGRETAPQFFDALIKIGCPCVVRFLTDDVSKIDCNDILVDNGVDDLRGKLQAIVDDSRDELNRISAEIEQKKIFADTINAELSAWYSTAAKLHSNMPLDDKIVGEFTAAAEFVETLTADNFKRDFTLDITLLRKIAVLRLISSSRAQKFFDAMRDARNLAAEKLKVEDEPTEETKRLAQIVPSDIERRIDEMITGVKFDIKEHAKKALKEKIRRAEMERWQKKQAEPKPQGWQLSAEQVKYLFSDLSTDLKNAHRLNYLFGDRIRYLTDTDRWLTFSKKEKIWVFGKSGNNAPLVPFAGKMARLLEINEPSPDDYPDAKKLIVNWQDSGNVGAAFSYLKSVDAVLIKTEDLNNHPHLLHVQNGVVDLQTGELYPNVDPKLLLTQKAGAAYRPGLKNDVVEKFLRDILPAEDRDAIIRFFGYCLTGSVREEKALFIFGKGGNGKGTLTLFLMHIFGNYAVSVPIDAVVEAGRAAANGAATPELNCLEKARLGIVEELKEGGRLDVAKFKRLTGGDKIPIRRLYQEYVHIEPTHKLVLSGNHLPTVTDTRDNGLLRRLLNVNFSADFRQNPDRALKEKLLAQDAKDAMLTLLVDAAQDWYKFGLIETNRMKDATHDYLAANDFLSAFVDDYCTYDDDGAIDRKSFVNKIRAEYPRECARLNDRSLCEAVAKIDGINYRRGGKTGAYQFFGIRWRRDSDNESQSGNLRGEPVTPQDTIPPEFDLSQFDDD